MENKPRRIMEAPFDTPMLEWWADDYDHVFIVLSPFFRVEGYTPETAAFGIVHAGSKSVGEIMDLLKNPVSRPNEAPDDFDSIIKRTGEPIHWREVQSAIGVDDYLTFCRAAWLWAIGSNGVEEYQGIVEKLDAHCRERGIYKPEEDQLPVILEPLVGQYLAALGIDQVTIYNEFRNKKITMPVAAFSKEQPAIEIPSEKISAIVSRDPKVMFTWSFDDTYGFLCLSDEARMLADPADYFEGQYAGVDTYSDWLNPPDFFERQKANKAN